MADFAELDRDRLALLIQDERLRYRTNHPRSEQLFGQAAHLFGRVPMTWMTSGSGGFPLYLDRRRRQPDHRCGRSLLCRLRPRRHRRDGRALARGRCSGAVRRRIAERGGLTAMLPTEDAEWVGAELSRRFGLPRWSFTLSATDANRWAIRLARLVTGRRRSWCSPTATTAASTSPFVVLGRDGASESRPGNVAPAVDPTTTTRVGAVQRPGLGRARARPRRRRGDR